MDGQDELSYRRGLNDLELGTGVDATGPAQDLDKRTPDPDDAYFRRYLNDNAIPEVED